jgi:dihydroorotate dehydrogenase electron transfer subunit
MIHQQQLQILSNSQISENYYQLQLKCDKAFETATPGQFVMIRLSDNYFPLLRRPFSIHNLFQNEKGDLCLELLYKVVGKGTIALSEYQKNQWLDVLGPIGNGFRVKDSVHSALLISGGIGVAPMLFLTKCLLENGTLCQVINGGRTINDILCTDIFQSLGVVTNIYTDDGSVGTKGFVTDHLENFIENQKPDILYACGPQPMLSKVTKISKQMNVACQVSLESHMACGMGACLGCAVPSDNLQKKYFHVCADGPVFWADQVNLENDL